MKTSRLENHLLVLLPVPLTIAIFTNRSILPSLILTGHCLLILQKVYCNTFKSIINVYLYVNENITLFNYLGEFTVMNYRVTGEMQPPFRVFPFIEETSAYKLEMNLKIKAMYPKTTNATFVTLKFAVPKQVSSVHNELKKAKLYIYLFCSILKYLII